MDLPGRFLVPPVVKRQGGSASLAQWRRAGLTDRQVRDRVRTGWMWRVHHGVYAVGQLTPRGHLWAAALAVRAPVSYWSAAASWDLMRWPSGNVDVTTTGRAAHHPGIRVHRSRTLTSEDVTRQDPDGLPVTTVARTLVDLATVLTPHRITRALHRAEELRLLDAGELRAAAQRAPGRRTTALKQALGELTAPDIIRSDAEELFYELVKEAGLPPPLVNHDVAGLECDFVWPEHRLIVETDGGETHATRRGFERDRRKDAKLTIAGWRVLRFSYWQIVEEPSTVLAALRAATASAPPARLAASP